MPCNHTGIAQSYTGNYVRKVCQTVKCGRHHDLIITDTIIQRIHDEINKNLK